jgi:predicted transposase YbfD/YdcC
MATFSGVARGYEDLADYAATLSQAQLRALQFRRDPHTGRVRSPERTTFERVLRAVDAELLQGVLLLWQEQVLGPVQDRLVIIDGKEIRHANVESVSAVDGSGRWLGSTLVREGSNEIPAGRQQLAKLDLVGKIVLSDAAHTQVAHARQILYQQGGNYLMTVKKNQKDLFETLETLFAQQRFSPSAHGAHPRPDAGEQPEPTGNPGAGLPGSLAAAGGLPRGADHCPAPAAGSASGQEKH